jgi:arylsulfatase A-like enzyme
MGLPLLLPTPPFTIGEELDFDPISYANFAGYDPKTIPHARGFERSFSMLFGGASYWSDMIGLLAEQEEIVEYVMVGKWLEELPGDFYATRSFTDFLIDSIRQNRGDGKPFLAYLAFTAPHDPMHVPEPWLSKYRGKYDDGYEVLKEKRAAAAIRMELVSNSAQAPERHQMLAAWDTLSKKKQALEASGCGRVISKQLRLRHPTGPETGSSIMLSMIRERHVTLPKSIRTY